MSAALYYLHHRPAAWTWRPSELPGKPSPLGQVCRIQVQAAQICKKKGTFSVQTHSGQQWRVVKRLMVPF